MIKFLLVLILFSPAEGQYREAVATFETEAQCKIARADVRRTMAPQPGIVFALACLPVKPTNSTDT